MKELVIKKKYINSELTPGEIMLLILVYDQNKLLFEHFLSTYGKYTRSALKSLENKLFIKINGEEFDDLIVREKGNKLLNEKSAIKFEDFWLKYHEITELPKTDKKPAIKKWNKLSNTSKIKALNNVQNYFDNLNDKRYCKKARTYLEDENFEDDYTSTSVDISINTDKV